MKKLIVVISSLLLVALPSMVMAGEREEYRASTERKQLVVHEEAPAGRAKKHLKKDAPKDGVVTRAAHKLGHPRGYRKAICNQKHVNGKIGSKCKDEKKCCKAGCEGRCVCKKVKDVKSGCEKRSACPKVAKKTGAEKHHALNAGQEEHKAHKLYHAGAKSKKAKHVSEPLAKKAHKGKKHQGKKAVVKKEHKAKAHKAHHPKLVMPKHKAAGKGAKARAGKQHRAKREHKDEMPPISEEEIRANVALDELNKND